jgi:hypothetical protein
MTLIIRRRHRSRDFPWLSAVGPYLITAVTPQRIAAHARSMRDRQARHHRAWGFLGPLTEPPATETIEERIARQNEATIRGRHERRLSYARAWRRARARLRELPREQAEALVAEWNARTHGAPAWGVDVLVFLDERAPTAERIAERREHRLQSARLSRAAAEQARTWWIEHVTCPEGGHGVIEIQTTFPRRLHCIACDATWEKADVAAADAEGTLRMVDCRLAEQAALPL